MQKQQKVDASLLPGLKEQLKDVISDEGQLNGLANMLASLPEGDRKGSLEKVKLMKPGELKERAAVQTHVSAITKGLS